MRTVESSDPNFYDRCYVNAHDRSGDVFLVAGLGVYPNLGVIDAFAVVRHGGRQHALRCSDQLPEDRLQQRVGAFAVEVLEPLRRLRLTCTGDELGIAFDLTWEGSFPATEEPPHTLYAGTRRIVDASRFAQVGTWEGRLRAGGSEWTVTPDRWVGSRDRSWGIRPVGEPEPPGRAAHEPIAGFWWLYIPIRFESYAVVLIAQEDPDGFRSLNEAIRVHPDGRIEQLGWPRVQIGYRSGTRHPEHALIGLTDSSGRPLRLEIDTLTAVALNVGAGYGGDPDWTHGQWRGPAWRDSAVYDLASPEVASRIPFGVVDHVARASLDGAEGWGLFEHASIGRHDPSGFADWAAVAR